MYKHYILMSILIFCVVIPVFGQTTDAEIQAQRREERKSQERERKTWEILTKNSSAANGERIIDEPARPSRRVVTWNSTAEFQKERKRIKALRAPNPEDLAKYKDFLKQPQTGLFRLFPDFGCDSKNLIRVDGDCEGAVTGSWAYSFRRNDYTSDFLDIRLKDGNLIADGFLSQEILVSLGNIPLEKVPLSNTGVMKFLVDFKPEIQIKKTNKQYKEIAATISFDGYRYGNNLKADLDTTYAARIVAYRNDDKKVSRLSSYTMSLEDKKFVDLKRDEREDLIIAFRIVRKDDDGNITILWKKLSRQKSPKLIFGKDEKLSDIKP